MNLPTAHRRRLTVLDDAIGLWQSKNMAKRNFTVTVTQPGLRQVVTVRAENEDHAISRAVTRIWGPRAYLEPGELLDTVMEVYPGAQRATRTLATGVLVEVV